MNQPNSESNRIELVSHSIIEHQLMTSLSDKSKVAILADKEDLDALIDALNTTLIFGPAGTASSIFRELHAGLKQLRCEAFENRKDNP